MRLNQRPNPRRPSERAPARASRTRCGTSAKHPAPPTFRVKAPIPSPKALGAACSNTGPKNPSASCAPCPPRHGRGHRVPPEIDYRAKSEHLRELFKDEMRPIGESTTRRRHAPQSKTQSPKALGAACSNTGPERAPARALQGRGAAHRRKHCSPSTRAPIEAPVPKALGAAEGRLATSRPDRT